MHFDEMAMHPYSIMTSDIRIVIPLISCSTGPEWNSHWNMHDWYVINIRSQLKLKNKTLVLKSDVCMFCKFCKDGNQYPWKQYRSLRTQYRSFISSLMPLWQFKQTSFCGTTCRNYHINRSIPYRRIKSWEYKLSVNMCRSIVKKTRHMLGLVQRSNFSCGEPNANKL